MRLVPGILAAILAMASIGHAAAAADPKRGETLLAHDCGRCHAVGRSGASADKDAPPFRTLGKRYPVEDLEESLGEGTLTGHPDMPEFKYEADEVGGIIAHLKSIQQP